ncbi:unnamed protein product [Spodoptera littoralis]|uniref:HTH psq-type domain-containing protein n=1 Tax=Spodoptera littoralis TaxID=7109 RepID=A0A9P0MVA3_SPOLI|nr:unnamed protein product [Spodoptera littoralis]CAH1634666.1 unnamed protein product [Spodoptera littoralis]
MGQMALFFQGVMATNYFYYYFQMPNYYVRKSVAVRGTWSEEDLRSAMESVQRGNMSVYRASITYNIPRKTLERRVKLNNAVKGLMIITIGINYIRN